MDYWPEVLHVPVNGESRDSNSTEINLEQNLDDFIYKTNNSFSLVKSDSVKEVKQYCLYWLDDDNISETQNHYIDLAGSFTRKKFPFAFSSLGFEWIPTAIFNRRPDRENGDGDITEYNSSGVGSLRLGPSIGIRYQNLPIRISGGGAVDVWQDNFPYSPGWSDVVESKGDPGFYGALTAGNNKRQLIEGIPFYAEGSIFGRYMKSAVNEKITNGEINALFFRDVSFADTFFLYAADTLSKGRTNKNQFGSAQFKSIPNRTQNSLQATFGINKMQSPFLVPSLHYRLSLASVTYPHSNDKNFQDRFNNKYVTHTVAVTAQNRRKDILVYDGGILFSCEDDDWVYKKEFKNIEVAKGDSILEDSLRENNNDFKGLYVQMYHRLNKKFTNNMEFNYTFDVNRYKVTYPNFFINTSANDTIINGNDKDEMNFTHTLNFILLSFPRIRLGIAGEYAKSDKVFLKKMSSSGSYIERGYRVESSLHINPDSTNGLVETFGGFARMGEYYFPEFQQTGPDLFRQYYSRLKGSLTLFNNLLLEGIWNEISTLDGEYVDSTNRVNPVLRYKESSVELNCSYRFPNNFIVQTGSLFRYIYYYYNSFSDSRVKKVMMPYLDIKAFLFNRLFIHARIERYIDPGRDDFWKAVSSLNLVF